MFYHAYNGSFPIGNSKIDYISFGKGSRNLVLLPGLGDGLSTVKGMAPVFALMYRIYADAFTVYIFSRKNHLQDGYSTREMAADQAEAMTVLGISKADILGISQGGMIAQYLAIDYPNLVHKLILAVTSAKPNDTLKKVVSAWMEMAVQGDYKKLIIDTAEKSYSKGYLKKHRWIYPFLGRIGKPKSFHRFLIQAASCISHNAYGELEKITCPVFVIGGDCDQITGTASACEIADKISGCRLFIYHGLGHAAYEEAEDFHEQVLHFLMK